jgi:hypothetical protein
MLKRTGLLIKNARLQKAEADFASLYIGGNEGELLASGRLPA